MILQKKGKTDLTMSDENNTRQLRPRENRIMLDEDLAIVNALREENMYFTDNEEHYPGDDDDYNDFLQSVDIDKQIKDKRIGNANYLNEISNGFTLEEDTGIVHNIRNHGHHMQINTTQL